MKQTAKPKQIARIHLTMFEKNTKGFSMKVEMEGKNSVLVKGLSQFLKAKEIKDVTMAGMADAGATIMIDSLELHSKAMRNWQRSEFLGNLGWGILAFQMICLALQLMSLVAF
jgi:hypothetical protein